MSNFCSLLAAGIPDVLRLAAILATAVLLYVYLGYPLLLAVLAPLFRRREPQAAYTPSLSVLIAAYNEEGAIARKIEQTLSLEYPADKLEIVVVSDGSSDRTAEIVDQIRDPRVKLVRIASRAGKTNAQNE